MNSETLRIETAGNNDASYDITDLNSNNFVIRGSGINNSINITNHSFLQNSRFWNCNLTGAGSSATITNMYGLRLHPPTNQTGLTINNNWGVYSGWSSSKNYFAGGVGIGTTNFSNALSVEGDVSLNGNVDISGNLSISNSLGVNTNTPDQSSLLDLNSTVKGFLPPRMNATQASAIVSPAEGLMVYVTNTNGTFTSKGWWGYDGALWKQLG